MGWCGMGFVVVVVVRWFVGSLVGLGRGGGGACIGQFHTSLWRHLCNTYIMMNILNSFKYICAGLGSSRAMGFQ